MAQTLSFNSRSLAFRMLVGLTSVLSLLFSQLQLGKAESSASFCPITLSRPTCPDLQTYDAFNVTTYGGRWFEIGSTANFKNIRENGGICVVANYTLDEAPSPGKGAVVGVYNTLYSLGNPLHNVSQVVISLTAGQICSQAFSICTEVDETNSNSSLAQGLALVSNVSLAIQDHDANSTAAASLVSAKGSIEDAMVSVNLGLDKLAKTVTKLQILTAQLGQGQGNVTSNVAALIETVADSNTTTLSVAKAVKRIEKERETVEKIAAKLALKGEIVHSLNLVQATAKILTSEGSITAQLAKIQSSLATVVAASPLFLTPTTGQKGYNGVITGTATQDSKFLGKLQVQFSGFPSGQYWVVAVEEAADGAGYAATVVYGCDQNGEGGIEETLFVLSRTPSLPGKTVERLLSKAAALGVTNYCSTPFIFTVQSPSCGNPPGFVS